MPGPPRGVTDESSLDWLELADFTPGCYDYSHVATTNPNVPAAKGALDPAQTFSCICLPHGGLGPLPIMAQAYAWPGTVDDLEPNYIVGLLVHDDLADGTTEAISIWQTDNGTNQLWAAWSYIPETDTGTEIISETNPTGGGLFGSPYPQMTRAAESDPTTTVGIPVCVFPGPSAPDSGTEGQIWMYPNPADPTDYGALGLLPDGQLTGQVLVHQSRILGLIGTLYDYPAGGGFVTNEQIIFTDPPNSIEMGDQMTVLAAEEPFGYGCGGSISAGELFLVKKRGGGVVVVGDIFSPNVTILPGVQDVGGIYGAAHSGMAGFVYCSYDNGAWLWNGGSTAQKISSQLDDAFFLPPEFPTMDSNNYGFYVRCIADRVYFSNNWVYDLNTSSWWRYYPDATQGGVNLFWVQEVDGGDIWCAKLSFDSTDTDYLYRFDQETPAETWQCQTLPIRLTEDRYVQIRQVIVRASSNDGNEGATIEVAVFNGTTQVGSVTTPAGQIGEAPTMIRMPIGGISAGDTSYASEDITIRITANGNGGAAPNLHTVSLGWQQRAHAPTVGVSE